MTTPGPHLPTQASVEYPHRGLPGLSITVLFVFHTLFGNGGALYPVNSFRTLSGERISLPKLNKNCIELTRVKVQCMF